MKDNHRKDDIEKPEKIIEDIENTLDCLHAKLIHDATEIGQARDCYRAIRPYWETIGNTSSDDPNAAQIYSSGVSVLKSVREDINNIANQYPAVSNSLGTIYPSTDLVINTTDTTAGFVLSSTVLPDSKWLNPVRKSDREKTREFLLKMDQSLADTYDEIWEILYGTRSDPERGSLFMIRQAFDHFFGILAPNDEVRGSKFWKPKIEPDQNLVTRKERLDFAAFKHIQDNFMSQRLLYSSKHIVDVYEALNSAHKRGSLKPEKARTALKEMNSIIENWVEGLILQD
jgi:hypothetical protein